MFKDPDDMRPEPHSPTSRAHGKVTNHVSVTVQVYEDGVGHATVWHLDPGNRRMIPGPSWCMPDVSVSRASLLWWVSACANDTRLLEEESPPLPW